MAGFHMVVIIAAFTIPTGTKGWRFIDCLLGTVPRLRDILQSHPLQDTLNALISTRHTYEKVFETLGIVPITLRESRLLLMPTLTLDHPLIITTPLNMRIITLIHP